MFGSADSLGSDMLDATRAMNQPETLRARGAFRPCLLVMDLQEDLCRDSRRARLVDEIVPRVRRAVEHCTRVGIPVVFTQFWLPPDDAQFDRFGDRYCIAGTEGAEIIRELRSLADQCAVVRKAKHSAFFDTNLEEILQSEEVTHIGMAGLQTHICIMTTAADASFRGFEPVALEDCVVSSQATKKAAALEWIEAYVGQVKTAAEFFGAGEP